MVAGGTAANVPEDLGNLLAKAKKLQIVMHVSFLRVDNRSSDVIVNISLHNG